MEWVRGGHWYPERLASPDGSFDFASMDDGRRALLHPLLNAAGRGELLFPHFMPPPELAPSEWWDELGRPAGLEPYDMEPRLVHAALTSFQAFVARFPFEPVAAVPPEVDAALCELLERWGPLEALPGVVPEPLTSDPDALRTVRLRDYHRQVRDLAVAYKAVEGKFGSRSELSEQIDEDSHAAFRDTEVYLRFESTRVLFDILPLSLRAYLWRYILGRWGRSSYRLCKLCTTRFKVPDRPGKPPLFCEAHRNPKSRKQAERLAPFTPQTTAEEQ